MGIVISSILHMRKICSFRDISRCTHDTSTHRLFTYFIGLGDTEYKNMLLCFLSTTGTHLSAVYCCDPLTEHVRLSDCLCWLLLLGGMQAWERAVTMALVFSCSNVKVWFRWEHDLCAPFISELPLGRAKVRKTISVLVAFSPVYSSFGSSGQRVSSSWRPSLLQYQWRKITPDSRSDLFWPRTGICVVRFRLPQLVAFITCFSQQGT